MTQRVQALHPSKVMHYTGHALVGCESHVVRKRFPMLHRLAFLVPTGLLTATLSFSGTSDAAHGRIRAFSPAAQRQDIDSRTFSRTFALDVVESGPTFFSPFPMLKPLLIPSGQPMVLAGWAVDSRTHLPAAGVTVSVDGSRAIRATYGSPRPDVARALGKPASKKSGYVLIVPASKLRVGPHVLSFKVLNKGNSGYHPLLTLRFSVYGNIRMSKPLGFFIDSLNGHLASTLRRRPLTVSRESRLIVSGWAADTAAGSAAAGVMVTVDDKRDFQADYGSARPDVARALRNRAYISTGFVGIVPTAGLAPGVHSVRIKIVMHDRRSYFEPAASVKIRIP